MRPPRQKVKDLMIHLCGTQNRKQQTNKQPDADDSMVVSRGQGGGRRQKRAKGSNRVTGGERTVRGEPTMQCVHDVIEDRTPETRIILLTNVTPMNLLKLKGNTNTTPPIRTGRSGQGHQHAHAAYVKGTWKCVANLVSSHPGLSNSFLPSGVQIPEGEVGLEE